MAPLICILLFGMHKYMAGDDERRGARTTVAKAVLFPPLEPILLMEPARRSSETQSHNAEHKAVEWSPAAPARSHARPHHKKPSLPVVNLILLCIGAGIIIIGFACIPYIARLSVVTSLRSVYELIVAEAAEAVGQGVVTRLNDAVATSQLGTNFIQTGFLSLDQYGDAFMVALLVGHPLFSAVYFGSNITGDFVGAVFTDYATSSVAIYNEDASTQGRLFEYTYSPVTASRNTSSVLYNSTGQYVPSSRPWFSHNFTVYSDFSSGDVVVTMSREYFSGGVFQGVFGVDIVVSNLLTYLESFHPVAGVSGSCIALLTTAGELVASSHPLVFGPSAVYGPVSKLPILNNNGSLPLDPFAGAMQLVFQEYASLDLITESFTVVTSDYVVAVYPLTGSNTQTFKSGGVVLPLVVIAAVSTEAYLPTIAGRIGGSVALTVLGIAVIVLFGWKGPSVLSKLTGGGGGGHGEHGGGHGGGGHGGGSHGGGGHGDHSTDASPFVTAVGFLGSTLLCFLVYYIWSYNDSTLIREPASYLALQSSLHFTQVVQGFSIQTAAVNFLDLFLLNTSNSPAPYAVYAPSTPIELHSIARIESFLTVLVSTLTISEPIVAQVMFGFDDGLLLGARADAQGIHIVASDDSTYGHLTLFDTTVNGTRNASAATEGLLYDPRRQDWWLQVVDEEVGHPVWSGVRQLFGEVVMGMTQSAKLVVNQSRTVVVAVDISTTLMSQNLGSLNITQYGGSGVVVSGSIKEMSIVASSADNYPFAFDSNGSMHSVPALQSEDPLIVEATELLEMYTVNSTETPCSQHEEFCITSLPEFLNDNVGVFQAAVVLSSISDKYGLNLLCYAIFPYQQFLLTLYDWHALSAGVVVGVVAAITFVVVWSSGYFVSLFSQKHGHGSGHVVHHNPVHVTHTTSEGHQSLLHPPTSSGGGHDHHRNTGAADYDSTFMLDKQLVSLLSCRDKLLEKVDLNVVETKAAFRAFCNTIEYGVRLTDQLPEYDTEFVASRMSVEPSRRKSLRLSISKRATDPVVTLFSRRAMSFLPTVLTAKKLSLSPPSFLHRLFPTNASRLATRVKAMGNSRASAGLDEDQLPMKIATYEASRQLLLDAVTFHDVGEELLFQSLALTGVMYYWHRWFHSTLFLPLLALACTLHHALVFVEGRNHTTLEYGTDPHWMLLTLANLLIILAYWFHTATYMYWGRRLKGKVNGKAICLAVLSAFFTVDLIVMWASHYTTGTQELQFQLQVTSVLRPLVLIVGFISIRRALIDFVMTIYESRAVLALAVAYFVVGATTATALFKGYTHTPYELGRGFDTFQASLLTMFIYITTAENYADLVYESVAHNKIAILYFVVFALAGLFFIIALLVANFQLKYHHRHLHTSALLATKRRAMTRNSFLSVYTQLAIQIGTLTGDRSVPCLYWKDVKEFLFTFCGLPNAIALDSVTLHRQQSVYMFDMEIAVDSMLRATKCDSQLIRTVDDFHNVCSNTHSKLPPLLEVPQGMLGDTYAIGPKEFLDQCDLLVSSFANPTYAGILSGKLPRDWRGTESVASVVERLLWSTRGIRAVSHGLSISSLLPIILTFIHLFLLLLYGSRFSSYSITPIVISYCCLLLELGVRIYRESWFLFWYPVLTVVGSLNPTMENYRVKANKADVGLALISLACLALYAILQNVNHGHSLDGGNLYMFGLSLPLFRMLLIGKALRRLMFGLLAAIPDFLSLFFMLGLVMYEFAIVGMWTFAGVFSELPAADYPYPQATFDSFRESLITLFHLIVGIGWDLIMGGAIDGTSELYASLYFVAFIVVFHILFGDVFIGIVCESYAKLSLQHSSISSMQQVLARGVIQRAALQFSAKRRARAGGSGPRRGSKKPSTQTLGTTRIGFVHSNPLNPLMIRTPAQ